MGYVLTVFQPDRLLGASSIARLALPLEQAISARKFDVKTLKQALA